MFILSSNVRKCIIMSFIRQKILKNMDDGSPYTYVLLLSVIAKFAGIVK